MGLCQTKKLRPVENTSGEFSPNVREQELHVKTLILEHPNSP
jgi:hypothetical protein